MIGKRLFWFTVGLGVGAGAAVEGRRRVQRVVRRATPAGMAASVGGSARALGRDFAAAYNEGRGEMRARESELRGEPGTLDARQ